MLCTAAVRENGTAQVDGNLIRTHRNRRQRTRNGSAPFEKTVENEWKIEAAYGGNERYQGIFVRRHIFRTARLGAVPLTCCCMWKRHSAVCLGSNRFALTKGRSQIAIALEMHTHSTLQKSCSPQNAYALEQGADLPRKLDPPVLPSMAERGDSPFMSAMERTLENGFFGLRSGPLMGLSMADLLLCPNIPS